MAHIPLNTENVSDYENYYTTYHSWFDSYERKILISVDEEKEEYTYWYCFADSWFPIWYRMTLFPVGGKEYLLANGIQTYTKRS